ncbi:MAG: inositol monophosphatase [SAR202 cluster bacterium]|nr:inositol monophosphatase [SAR202 cluster bacterium]
MTHASPDPHLLERIEAGAVEMARGAGDILARHFGKTISVEYKDKKQSDPVSEADHETQAFLVGEIARLFPDHDTVGEEDDKAKDTAAGALPDFVWVLDPLDGTKNFLAGVPTYASSIGILYRGKPVAGAIFVPWPTGGGIVLHAREGHPACVDAQPLPLLDRPEPRGNALAALPAAAWRNFKVKKALHGKTGEVRVTGSLAYEMALVAYGRLQYMVTTGPMLWDVAAGAAIVAGAGGASAVARKRTLVAGLQTAQWTLLDSFVPDWNHATKKDLREWSHPMVSGSKGVVNALMQNLTFGARWKPRLGRRRPG